MMTDFTLPDLGEGLTEAEIVRWMVAPGDTVTLNQVICEVETAKALVELPSPIAGTVGRLCVAEGDTVNVGTPIIEFGEPDEGRSSVLVGYGPGEHDARNGRKRRTRPHGASAGSATGVAAKPPVRRLAKDRGIDITSLVGSGPEGHITRADVEGTSTGSASTSSATVKAEEIRVPIAGVRKRTAEAMVRSAFTAPHVTEFVTIDVTATVDLVAKLREHPAFSGVRVTPLLIVARALLFALARHPELGSRWDEEAQEIVTTRAINLGIAVATPRGLLVPNIKDAASLSLVQLASELAGLADRAREGTTALAEFAGGTISITNIGGFGIDTGTPIINPGEAAILCVGAIRRQPWEFNDEIALRSVLTLSLSFDHRLVDGFEGSGFLSHIARVLSDPTELIALG